MSSRRHGYKPYSRPSRKERGVFSRLKSLIPAFLRSSEHDAPEDEQDQQRQQPTASQGGATADAPLYTGAARDLGREPRAPSLSQTAASRQNIDVASLLESQIDNLNTQEYQRLLSVLERRRSTSGASAIANMSSAPNDFGSPMAIHAPAQSSTPRDRPALGSLSQRQFDDSVRKFPRPSSANVTATTSLRPSKVSSPRPQTRPRLGSAGNSSALKRSVSASQTSPDTLLRPAKRRMLAKPANAGQNSSLDSPSLVNTQAKQLILNALLRPTPLADSERMSDSEPSTSTPAEERRRRRLASLRRAAEVMARDSVTASSATKDGNSLISSKPPTQDLLNVPPATTKFSLSAASNAKSVSPIKPSTEHSLALGAPRPKTSLVAFGSVPEEKPAWSGSSLVMRTEKSRMGRVGGAAGSKAKKDAEESTEAAEPVKPAASEARLSKPLSFGTPTSTSVAATSIAGFGSKLSPIGAAFSLSSASESAAAKDEKVSAANKPFADTITSGASPSPAYSFNAAEVVKSVSATIVEKFTFPEASPVDHKTPSTITASGFSPTSSAPKPSSSLTGLATSASAPPATELSKPIFGLKPSSGPSSSMFPMGGFGSSSSSGPFGQSKGQKADENEEGDEKAEDDDYNPDEDENDDAEEEEQEEEEEDDDEEGVDNDEGGDDEEEGADDDEEAEQEKAGDGGEAVASETATKQSEPTSEPAQKTGSSSFFSSSATSPPSSSSFSFGSTAKTAGSTAGSFGTMFGSASTNTSESESASKPAAGFSFGDASSQERSSKPSPLAAVFGKSSGNDKEGDKDSSKSTLTTSTAPSVGTTPFGGFKLSSTGPPAATSTGFTLKTSPHPDNKGTDADEPQAKRPAAALPSTQSEAATSSVLSTSTPLTGFQLKSDALSAAQTPDAKSDKKEDEAQSGFKLAATTTSSSGPPTSTSSGGFSFGMGPGAESASTPTTSFGAAATGSTIPAVSFGTFGSANGSKTSSDGGTSFGKGSNSDMSKPSPLASASGSFSFGKGAADAGETPSPAFGGGVGAFGKAATTISSDTKKLSPLARSSSALPASSAADASSSTGASSFSFGQANSANTGAIVPFGSTPASTTAETSKASTQAFQFSAGGGDSGNVGGTSTQPSFTFSAGGDSGSGGSSAGLTATPSAGSFTFSAGGSGGGTTQGSTTSTEASGFALKPAASNSGVSSSFNFSAGGAGSGVQPPSGSAQSFGGNSSQAPAFGAATSQAASGSGFSSAAASQPNFNFGGVDNQKSDTKPSFSFSAGGSGTGAAGASSVGSFGSGFGQQSSGTPAFSAGGGSTQQSSGTPTFGAGGGTTPSFGASSGTGFGQQSSGTPTFGAGGGTTPSFGAGSSTGFGQQSSGTPTFGAGGGQQSSGTPTFGNSMFGAGSAQSSGSSAPFGGAPQFGSASSPATSFGAGSSGFGSQLGSSTPSFGAGAASNSFGAQSQGTPTFGAQTSGPFGGQGALPAPSFGGQAASTPAFGVQQGQAAFGAIPDPAAAAMFGMAPQGGGGGGQSNIAGRRMAKGRRRRPTQNR